nr:glycosyltransferase [Rhodoblastus sphagnicola]
MDNSRLFELGQVPPTYLAKLSNCKGISVKVLHVIGSVDPQGGGPIEGVFSSSKVWLDHGHDRHILCLDPPDAPWVQNSAVSTFAVGISGRWYQTLRKFFPLLRYGYTPHLTSWLYRYASNYDAVVVNGLWNYASFGAWRGLRKQKTPYFVFTHGMLDPWFNVTYPLKTFFKTIFWKAFEHKVLRDARSVLFTCEEERQLACSSFAPYVARETVVGYGTRDISGDPEQQREAFLERVPEVRGRKFVLFLSRIHRKKGVDLLIDAFGACASSFPEFDLVIAGPDQEGLKVSLQQRAADLGIAERIHWPGMLSGDAKWGAFRAAEFFALPSHQENFGIVVAEAMALGRPVLITNKVNIWREIESDHVGVVVNDDHDGVACGLRIMLGQSQEEREDMGARARRSFLARYDLEKNALDLLEVIGSKIGMDVNAPKEGAGDANAR